jgi:hypothetical protein
MLCSILRDAVASAAVKHSAESACAPFAFLLRISDASEAEAPGREVRDIKEIIMFNPRHHNTPAEHAYDQNSK